jgi:XapX domain-containing protein
MVEIGLGATELQAAAVGLVTGLIYTFVRAPIPAPNVLGGIFAILGTFIGFIAVSALRGQLSFTM